MTDDMLAECLRKDSGYITELVNANSEGLDLLSAKQMLVNIQTNMLRAAHALDPMTRNQITIEDLMTEVNEE